MGNRVFNFAAGPSQLPLEVLQKAGNEITDYHGTGMSVSGSSAAAISAWTEAKHCPGP